MRFYHFFIGAVASCIISGLALNSDAVDENTTFYASFDNSAKEADYALGWKGLNGSGAQIVQGVKGNAIDVRMRPIMTDFMKKCDDYTPTFVSWGFSGEGNINSRQGTFECWFRVADMSKDKRNIMGTNFIAAAVSRNLVLPDEGNKGKPAKYGDVGININQYEMLFNFSFLDKSSVIEKIRFKDIKGFGRNLNSDEWHYFTMCWSSGELVVYIDGKAVKAWDISGKLGLVLYASPVRFLSMLDVVLDELHISDIVRYRKDFEPAWPNAGRPAYAFTGNPDAKRYPGLYEPPPVPTTFPAGPGPIVPIAIAGFKLEFHRTSGSLIKFDGSSEKHANGLLLSNGLERKPMDCLSVDGWKNESESLSFTQKYPEGISAGHRIVKNRDNIIFWEITLSNGGEKEIWLEPLLSIPVTMRVNEFFDGSEIKTDLKFPRHRDLYKSTLPYVAASDGRSFIGIGLDPGELYSDLVGEWLPETSGQCGIRQGIKIALGQGEMFTLKYKLLKGEGEFGCKDAVDAYHQLFPQLYRFLPDVPVYSYMPATEYEVADKAFDLKRVGYAGGFWGHGPGHDKGDEFGSERFWNRKDFGKWPNWNNYTNRLEKMYGSLKNIHELVPAYYKNCYDSWYPVRRFHTCPDVFPAYYLNELWPGCAPNDDLLLFGQYYLDTWNWYMINEYNTPAGKHIMEQAILYHKAMQKWSPGFINDMSHAGSLYRLNDEIAQQTPGRSFSRDLGTFVRKSFGRKDRYEHFNRQKDERGFRTTFWSDGGAFSYTLCAYSSALAIEGAGIFKDLMQNGGYMEAARFLIGEKPMSSMTHLNDDWIGFFIDHEKMTPEILRDYYRYCSAQLMLFCMKNGITLDPAGYNNGKQFMFEYNPALVESTTLGRRLVDGAKVASPLWVRRSGKGTDHLLIVGNEKPEHITTDVTCSNRYFEGAPLFANWLGGTTEHDFTDSDTSIKKTGVPARTPVIFKQVGLLAGKCGGTASTEFGGDGISMKIRYAINLSSDAALTLNSFAPIYRFHGLKVNGEKAVPTERLALKAGANTIEVELQNKVFDFSGPDWNAVELIKGNQTNFYLIADKGADQAIGDGQGGALSKQTFTFGFERGTAMMLSDFIHQYDTEDGIPGNLKLPEFADTYRDGYHGWAVELKEDRASGHGQVRINKAKRLISISGKTQGEIRRAMVVFMRLVDRKYPHIDRLIPMRYRKAAYVPGKPLDYKNLCLRVKTREFYEKFSDPLFLHKPVLNSEYESLYENDNMDFAGKFMLKISPYIFEPTYADDFVYGYSGPKMELLKFGKDGILSE